MWGQHYLDDTLGLTYEHDKDWRLNPHAKALLKWDVNLS